MDLTIDKKLDNKKLKNSYKWNVDSSRESVKDVVKRGVLRTEGEGHVSGWNFLYAFVLFGGLFAVLLMSLTDLQIVNGQEMVERSVNNKVRLTSIPAYRGVVFDVNGEKLVENLSSMNVYLSLESYLDVEKKLKKEQLQETSDTLLGILGDDWVSLSEEELEYDSIYEKVVDIYESNPYASKILIATDINDDIAIEIKSKGDLLEGVSLDNGNKRHYLYDGYFTHILGYTGEASSADIELDDSLEQGNIVGKVGLEYEYDSLLRGVNGVLAEEIDVLGRSVTNEPYTVKPAEAGKNIYLSINKDTQIKLYSLIEEAVKEHGATGGAGVIEDVNTGEILAIVTYPSYDSNLFIGGISYSNYSKLLNDPDKPLINRALAAQMPPGSTFKTLSAVAGLDSGVINEYSKYTSRTGYTFSNGAPFQEFRNHSYGVVDVKNALAVSSNIFFCEMIRDWDMNEFVPYLEAFGIGQYTGIDIPGEAPGRLPSPENKIKLANTTSPWLDPVWYPEGDSCNSVIGQGITLVTPIQMSNWMAAIANGGTLQSPHVAKKTVDEKGFEEVLEYEPIRENVASEDAIRLTREGMWEVVNGSRGIAKSLSSTGVTVAAKTGTAEFGKLNSKGIYEHTHAWVGGFFPYENPQYSFSVFLEDGGMSSNSSAVARQMITWMVQNDQVE